MLVASIEDLASAAEPARDAALAETLFQEGKTLLAKGAFAEACPKLAESQRLDPGDGTLLALGVCHESEGKLALAWSELTLLASKGDARADRVQKAKERLAAIEPRLARVGVIVPEKTRASAPGLEVLRDGAALAMAAWGTSSPIDPGTHVIEAKAPGKKSVRIELKVTAGRATDVVLPPLEDAPPPSIAAATEPSREAVSASSGRGGAMRVSGVVLGAVGLASIGVGVWFGVHAFQYSDDAKLACANGGCNDEALAKNQDAKDAARVANITIGAGASAVAAGALLYLFAPKKAPLVTPYIEPTGAGAALRTTF
jgi:hypothetical protein